MKTMRRLFFALPVLAMAMTMSVSCTSDDEIMEQPVQDPSTEERVPRYAVMNLEGGKVPFDTTTRTATADWDDEARIYLQFTVGTKLVDGVATYSNSGMSFRQNLLRCECRHCGFRYCLLQFLQEMQHFQMWH